MRTITEEFGPTPPENLREPLGENEYIVRANLRTETREKEDGTSETVYVADSIIYSTQEYIALLQTENDVNAQAIAELADIVLTGGSE